MSSRVKCSMRKSFSAVNLINTKLRNRFSTHSVASVIFAKQGLHGRCDDFGLSKAILARFDTQICATATDNNDDEIDDDEDAILQ